MSNVAMPTDLPTAQAMIEQLQIALRESEREIVTLKHRLDVISRRMFGKRSEQLDPTELLFAMNEAKAEEKAAANNELGEPDGVEADPDKRKAKKGRSRHGRAVIPDAIPREVRRIDPESLDCPCCNQPMKQIGEEVSEVLEEVPAKRKVIRTVRPKYACGTCKEGVVVAPMPPSAIKRCKAGPGLLAKVAIDKYADHLPLYRQSQRFEREGIEISDRTLGGWLRQVAEVLGPIARAQWKSVMSSHVLGADETTVLYLEPGKRGSHKGYFCAYVGDRREVVFDFSTGRGGDSPLEALRRFGGAYLQVDGYQGYNESDRAYTNFRRVGCWAHARRKFFDERTTEPDACILMLSLIGRLYDIERKSREATFATNESRLGALHQARQGEGASVLARIRAQLETHKIDTLPKSPLGSAVRYVLNQWDTLTVYIEDPAIPIDNNQVERQMRAAAIGRKNWLFAGSKRAGRSAALFYSLINTCKLRNIDPHAWLVPSSFRCSRC